MWTNIRNGTRGSVQQGKGKKIQWRSLSLIISQYAKYHRRKRSYLIVSKGCSDIFILYKLLQQFACLCLYSCMCVTWGCEMYSHSRVCVCIRLCACALWLEDVRRIRIQKRALTSVCAGFYTPKINVVLSCSSRSASSERVRRPCKRLSGAVMAK
jgi:hypothetical protein